MHKGYIKHVFASGITSIGFVSFYEYILKQKETSKILIIKGDPGTGKSTFMKKIAEQLLEKGFYIEYLHCPFDCSSLVGISIPYIDVALVDGTSPNLLDSLKPELIDEIINLSQFLNKEEIKLYKPQIIETSNEINKNLERAFKYLKAAKIISDDTENIYNQATDFADINIKTQETIDKIFNGLKLSNSIGKTRNFFASAITSNGLKNYIDSIIHNVESLYIVKGEVGTGKSSFLSTILDYAIARGLKTEIYRCVLNPKKIEHVLIPQLNTVFVTSNEFHNVYKNNCEEIIDFNEFVNKNEISKYQTQLNYNRSIYNNLINQAILSLNDAKRSRDLLEIYYEPNMDFDSVEKTRKDVTQKIFQYAQDFK